MSSPAAPRRPPQHLPGLFIAGTDTGVGKTSVAAAILRHARNQGRCLIPFKPVETGTSPLPGDALLMHEAARPPVPPDLICLYPFTLPAAPLAAAAHAGVSISVERIVERARYLASIGTGLIVEAAGGLLVPYRPDLTGVDLASWLGLPVLLVARTALGTINHVALSLNELRRRRLPFAGLILVQTQPDRQPHETTNLPLIRQLTGVDALATLPYLPRTTPDDLAQAFVAATRSEDLDRLLLLAEGSLAAARLPAAAPSD
jgi:dethiobiotin synthetase